jgi:hypothetical protein
MRRASNRRLVPLDKNSGAARYYERMRNDIASDPGGPQELTRIEDELIKAFAGSATRLEYLNHQVLLGDVTDVPIADYSNLASTMLRIGSRLGFRRRARDVTPSLDQYLTATQSEEAEVLDDEKDNADDQP